MAEEQVLIDIEVNTGKAQQQLASVLSEMQSLREEQKRLKDASKESGVVTTEQAQRLVEIESAMKANKATAKSLTAEINQASKSSAQYGDSLNEMRRYLSDLQAQYDGLSKSERENADIGGKLRAEIKEQHEAVLELEGSTGRMQRNVGNYQSAVEDLIPGMGRLNSMLGKVGLSMNDFSTNGAKAFSSLGQSVKAFGKLFLTPPIAIIAAVVGAIYAAFEKLREAFKRSDDASTSLSAGLAILKPIGTAISKIFDELANVIGKMVEGMGKAVIAAVKLANAVGIGDGEFVRAAESAQKLVHSVDDLEEAERNYTRNEAERLKTISKLRVEAEETQDPKRRKALLDEATKLEEQNLQEHTEILRKRVDNLKKQAKQEVDTSDETKNAIAQAEADLARAEKESYDRRRRLTSQLRAARQAEAAEAQARADKELEIATKLQQAMIDATEDAGMRELLQLQLRYDQEIEGYKKQLNDKKNLTRQAQDDLTALILLATEERDKALQELTAKQAAERLAQTEEHEKRILQLKIDTAEEGSEEERELRLIMAQLQFDEAISQLELEDEEKIFLEKQYLQNIAAINEEYRQQEKQKEQESLDERINRQTKAAASYSEAMNNMLSVASSAFSELANLYDEDAENDSEAKRKKRAFAATSIALNEASVLANTATSIAAAVAAAAEASVFTGPAAPVALAAFITSMVAAVVAAVAGTASTISQAKQLLKDTDAGQYSTGGIVGGTSYTGDRLTAHVNSGEMIFDKQQQLRLFNIANGQGGFAFDYSVMAEAMAAAVAAQPAPVMVYSEFRAFENRRNNYEELTKI